MAMDITKNDGDRENYSKEFIELQSQMNQIGRQQFNGISLFANNAAAAVTGELNHSAFQAYGGGGTYEAFSRHSILQHQDKLRTEVYHSM